MNQVAAAALIAWPVVALVLFATLPGRWAAIASFLGAWLLLPPEAGFVIQGLPEYTKFSAADLGALLGILLFDTQRLTALRPRRIDLVMVSWCLVPAVSILANGLPPWNAVTFVTDHVVFWGVPYLVGRIYFDEPAAAGQLAMGVILGGLAIIPMVVFEIATERSLLNIVYGIPHAGGHKWGLYNMRAFAAHQLELGMWAVLAALVAFWLWCTRAVPRLLGMPFGLVTAMLIGNAILCHQTGAIALMIVGLYLIGTIAGRQRFGSLLDAAPIVPMLVLMPSVGIRNTLKSLAGLGGFHLARLRRPQAIAWALVLVTPLYIVGRTSGALTGRNVSFVASVLFGSSRAHSLRYRLIQEDRMVENAMRRPLFGWGSFQGGRGRQGIGATDGTWMIYLGKYGLVGVASLYGVLCLPPIITARRYPVARWADPRDAPPAALAVALVFYAIDSLLNAAPVNPIWPLTAGALITLPPRRASRAAIQEAEPDEELARIDRLAALGRPDEAEAACRRLIAARSASPGSTGLEALAAAYEHLADLLEANGRLDEAEPARHRALQVREALAVAMPGDPGPMTRLSLGYERLARTRAGQGAVGLAIAAWDRALELRDALADANPDDPEVSSLRADGLNDLAWLLAMADDPAARDPRRAVALAEHAVRLDPGRKAFWNTLGAAYDRAGEPGAAVAALDRSRQLGPDDLEFDDALLALAFAHLGEDEAARDALARLDARLAGGRPVPTSLRKLRDEAAEALRPSSIATAP